MKLPNITPGPWTVDEYGIDAPSGSVLSAVDGHVYDEYDSDSASIDISEANAKAIAAVPAMLEALNEARQFVNLCTIDADYEVQDEARTALGNLDAALRLAGATDD